MRKFSCLIIDDEELGRDLLENFIGRVPSLKLLGKFSNPLKALSSLNNASVDIIFLDIQMPEMTGIEFLKTLSKAPAVIFTTAYDQYALEGYELSIVDYLLKPFSFTRFLQAVNKATELINLKLHSNAHAGLPQESNLSNAVEEDFLLINADHKLYRLYLKDILYIQSMREYVVYYTAQEKIMAFGSLKSLEGQLPETDFIRIHKSYIVAKKSVKSLQGNQLDIGITMLPIGGVYRDKVVSKLFDRSGKD